MLSRLDRVSGPAVRRSLDVNIQRQVDPFDLHHLPFAVELSVVFEWFDDQPDRATDGPPSSGLELAVEDGPVSDEDFPVSQPPALDSIDPVVVIDQCASVGCDLCGSGDR